MKTTMTGAVLALALGLTIPATARAQNTSSSRHAASMSDLAASYNVQPSEIQNLRDKGWSWSDVGKALAISKRSGQPLQELVAQKDSGMSWTQIADKNGFKLDEIDHESKALAKDFRQADKDARTGQAIRGAGEAPESRAYPQNPNQLQSPTPSAPNTTP